MTVVLAPPKTASPLTDLPGVGEALAERIAKEFGSADAFFASLREADTV